MGLTPLADNPQKDNGTPLNGGLNVRSAQSYIAEILDDDGHAPGDGEPSNRELNEGGENTPPDDSADTQEQDIETGGDTEESEGDGDIEGDEIEDGDEIQADSDDTDAGEITSLAELADALEMPIDGLKDALKHTFKAAGEEHTVTLSELEKGYQLQADYDRNKSKLADQRKAFEDEQKLRVESFQQQSTALAQSFNLAEQVILADYGSEAMNQLRVTDPTEWLIKQREGEQRLAQLNHARQNAASQYDQVMKAEHDQYLAREGELLSKTIDGWDDDKLRTAVDTIKTLGFNDTEVVNIVDHRLIQGALELKRLRAENEELNNRMANANKAVNKVKKKVPKIPSGGKLRAGGKGSVKKSTVNKLRKRLSKSNHINDAANLIESLME
jgi:hypothetical protein